MSFLTPITRVLVLLELEPYSLKFTILERILYCPPRLYFIASLIGLSKPSISVQVVFKNALTFS